MTALLLALALSPRWVVDAPTAKARIEAGQVTVLDARGPLAWAAGHAPGAVRVDWRWFTPSEKAGRGRLLDDDAALNARLQGLGVSASRPVIVVGDPPDDWGEDGRVVWMLRALGHPDAAFVDGGQRALVAAGLAATTAVPPVRRGDFVVRRDGRWTAGADALRTPGTVLIDARSPAEYAGATPHGEARGGHVPEARSLHFRDLRAPDGRLLPRAEIEAKLAAIGVRPDTPVVAYCTGGVRSAWLVAVLADLGYGRAASYPGSMWEWSAGDPSRYPLRAP